MADPEWSLELVERFDWTIPPPPSLNVNEAELKRWILEALPELTVHMAESDVKELIDLLHTVEIGHLTAHVIEWFAGHESVVAVLASRAAVVGELVPSAVVVLIMWDTLTSGMRFEAQRGYCTGLMREALGLPDVDPETYMGNYPDSEGELEAWRAGVHEGRVEFHNNPELRKSIALAILYEYAVQEKNSAVSPADNVLNRIWEKHHEDVVGLRGTRLELEHPGYQYIPKVPQP